MGCHKSKFDNSVCERDETPKMHQEFIKKNGLEAYYQIMGLPKEVIQPGIEDKSQTFNVGLLNYESKEETTNTNNFDIKFHWKTIVEVILGFLIVIYIAKRLIRYCKSKKAKASQKKNLKMKEIMKETLPSAPTPAENPFHPPYPIALANIKNNANSNSFPKRDIPTIKVLQQDTIPNQIVPLFSNSLYD